MTTLKNSFIAALVLSIASCTNSANNKLILGKWTGTEWAIDGKPSNRDAAGTHFMFDDQGNYSFVYSGTEQKGTYKVENDMLFTTPAGQQEIMVRITKLNNDSLIFDMNRAGASELLTLLKDK